MLFDRLKSDAESAWRSYVDHEFVQLMGTGELPKAAFQHYLVQDYLFLIQFARAYALGVYKSRTLAEMNHAKAGLSAILDVEMDLHVRLCADWGLSKSDLEQAPESSATLAYTRFVLEAGQAGDLLDLFVALAPCMIGYGEIGKALSPRLTEGHPYQAWISEYAGEEYQAIAEDAKRFLDELSAEMLTEQRYPRLLRLFESATRLEADFWQMGLDGS